MVLTVGVFWKYYRLISILKHADDESISKTFFCCVEVADHRVAPPPPNDPDDVWVHPLHEECHSPSGL